MWSNFRRDTQMCVKKLAKGCYKPVAMYLNDRKKQCKLHVGRRPLLCFYRKPFKSKHKRAYLRQFSLCSWQQTEHGCRTPISCRPATSLKSYTITPSTNADLFPEFMKVHSQWFENPTDRWTNGKHLITSLLLAGNTTEWMNEWAINW